MSDRTIPIVIMVGTLLSIMGAGSYQYGKHQGFIQGDKVGYQTGYKKGDKDGYNSAPKPTYEQIAAESNYTDLVTNYNKLVNDYNNLRTAAIRYIGAASYRQYSPITCNTHIYSGLNSNSTTCY